MEKTETFFEKEKRLKKRTQDFKMTYKKGLFYANKDRLIEYLQQPDVLVRVHASGSLNDDNSFITISIEGFKAAEDGI
jgi:hypothetical protein